MTSEGRHRARRLRRENRRRAKRDFKHQRYDDFEKVISLDSLYKAADEAQKGVKWKASVQRYNMTRMLNIYRAHKALKEGRDIRKGFICFDLIERGKLRHIKSVHFSERVIQKSICRNALYPILTDSLIYDNGASQRGKGTKFALDRLTLHLVRHYHRHGRTGGILLIDFKDYFGQADHESLKRIYKKNFKDERLKKLGMMFIEAFGDRGLGLGSETSQVNAVSLRNGFDHYAKEVLRIKGYGAYMDDSYLIHEDIGYLKECLEKLKKICEKYGITINEKKTKICDLKHGFTYLKTRFYITETGKIIKKPCRKAVTRQRRKLKKQHKMLQANILEYKDIQTSYASWRGSMKYRNAYHTVKNMDALYNNLFIKGWERRPYGQEEKDAGRDPGRDKRI